MQLVNQYIERIEAFDRGGPELNSVIRINPDAVRIAQALDTERQIRGARSLLHGVPILVKDNYNVPGMPTTGGSVALANFIPSAPASQIERLIDAGAIMLAKTNLHEFAYGITTVGSIFGRTRNPTTCAGCRAAPAAAQVLQSRQVLVRLAWGQIPVGQFGYRPHLTIWWGCDPQRPFQHSRYFAFSTYSRCRRSTGQKC